jgi:uncharacterized membrane protein YedE/YeeE
MHIFALAGLGGALIGTAAATLLLFNGRIAGISGILGTVLAGDRAPWRFAFLGGLIAAAVLATLVRLPVSAPVLDQPAWLYLAGGLLVGLGTRVGSGCTSGHGVCGLSNFSLRSLVATLTFMATAAATVFVVRHVIL